MPGRACCGCCVRTGCDGRGRGPPSIPGVVGRGGEYGCRICPGAPGRARRLRRRRLDDARLRDLWPFGGRQRSCRLWSPPGFFDAQPNRWRHEAASRLCGRRCVRGDWRSFDDGSGFFNRRGLFLDRCRWRRRSQRLFNDDFGDRHNRRRRFGLGRRRSHDSDGRRRFDDLRFGCRRRWCEWRRERLGGWRCRGLDDLDEARWTEDGSRRLCRLGLFRGRRLLRTLGRHRVFGEHVAAR
jgi:hypothetical protein